MIRITQDIHIHTYLSSCAKPTATAEEYLERASADGLTRLGFSNHLWDSDVPGSSRWYAPQNVEHVLELKPQLPALEQRFGQKILFGCETELAGDGTLALTEEHMKLFDYILVPHSHTHMNLVMPREYLADNTLHAQFLMDSFLRAVNHPLSRYFTSIAHPFVPGTRFDLYNDVQRLIPDGYFRNAFSIAAEKGIAIEVNGSCFNFHPEEQIDKIEYIRIFSIAKECGCKFTYGSDSHDCESPRKMDFVVRVMEKSGIRQEDLLVL